MPYKKPEKIPFQGIADLINAKRISPPKLAVILECTAPTARTKMNDPRKFTLGDIERIIRFGHIPVEDIREEIKL